MTDRKTRYRVERNGFGATVNLFDHDIQWTVGSCQPPPLGTADEMSHYEIFIETVVNVCHLLNRPEYDRNEAEQAYIRSYCK